VSSEIKLRTPGKRAFSDRKVERPKLRLVVSNAPKPLPTDPELKALIEKLQRPHKAIRRDDDGPDAA
jgi:hypothetical protein